MKKETLQQIPLDQALSLRFDSLYQWLHRKYQLCAVEVTMGQHLYRIYKIGDINAALEDVIRNSAHPNEDAPYWAELWHSSIALGEFLSRKNLKGRNALGLGSGVGAPEMVARRAGANMALSDNQEDALRLGELNWIANFHESPQLLKLDWRYPEIKQQFDLLVAADVVYEPRLFAPLIHTFDKLLQPGGEIWLSEPNRSGAEKFFDLLKEEGFEFERFNQRIRYEEGERDVSIYRIWRRSKK